MNLTCTTGHLIVNHAWWGTSIEKLCSERFWGNNKFDESCKGEDVTKLLAERCDGRDSCTGKVAVEMFGRLRLDPCPNMLKSLEIIYLCEQPTTPICEADKSEECTKHAVMVGGREKYCPNSWPLNNCRSLCAEWRGDSCVTGVDVSTLCQTSRCAHRAARDGGEQSYCRGGTWSTDHCAQFCAYCQKSSPIQHLYWPSLPQWPIFAPGPTFAHRPMLTGSKFFNFNFF